MVPIFKPIMNSSDLPPQNFERERFSLDAKGKNIERYSNSKLAEHIAAFANGIGGIILVGANEGNGGTYVYDPMTEVEADKVRLAYEHANRDLCSPKPTIEANVIVCEGGFVVAINCWPFLGQAVGTRSGPPDKASWCFPLRVGTQTTFLRPEQLPMISMPEIRKPAILLSQITRLERVTVLNEGTSSVVSMLYEDVHLQSATFSLRRDESSVNFFIPLEGVYLVWKDLKAGWQIAIRGYLDMTGRYTPTTQRVHV